VDQVEKMRQEATQGKPQLLIASPEVNTGVLMGYWSIVRVEETGTDFLPGGIPRKIEFRLELSYYGEDLPR